MKRNMCSNSETFEFLIHQQNYMRMNIQQQIITKQHFDTENKTTLFKHSPFKLHSFKVPEICFSFSDFRKNIFWL